MTIVVLNPNDPRVSFWEDVCSKRADLVASIERVPDAQEIEYQVEMILGDIDKGSSVVFEEGGQQTADKQVVHEQYKRHAREVQVRRARERREFELE